MDKRKKRTSITQYLLYIELLEKDAIFRSGVAPRDSEPNYINNKWRDLATKLNTCVNGPQLSPEEWKKRLNDWKNSTRCKYRRSVSGEKGISMSPLEIKALSLFGKTPVFLKSTQVFEFKTEAKALYEAEKKHQEEAKAKDSKRDEQNPSIDEEIDRIFIDDEDYNEDGDENEVNDKKFLPAEIVNTDVQKAKRRRTVEAPIYEIKCSPHDETIICQPIIPILPAEETRSDPAATDQPPPTPSDQQQPVTSAVNHINFDTQGVVDQLKRLADIKAAKLRFEIAKYKFNNPGFEYSIDPL